MQKQSVLHIVLGLIGALLRPHDRLLFGAQLRTYTQTDAEMNIQQYTTAYEERRVWLHRRQ